MLKLILKNRAQIIKILKELDSNLSDSTNLFYIENAGKVITIDAYCEEERIFTCYEFPDYAFPIEFISNVCTRKVSSKPGMTNKEIGKFFNCTAENIRKTIIRAINKLNKIIVTQEREFEYAN